MTAPISLLASSWCAALPAPAPSFQPLDDGSDLLRSAKVLAFAKQDLIFFLMLWRLKMSEQEK